MVPTNNQNLTSIYQMALGLERWFPNNNGPFAYGTRLCEETGELTEALYDWVDGNQDTDSKHHLIKETEDVLQIITGVLGYYGQIHKISHSLQSFIDNPKSNISKDHIIELVIYVGHFADAINHAESQGIKKQKRKPEPEERLVENATTLIACIAQYVDYYNLFNDLEKQIQKDYTTLTEKGFIG